jgi:hypothetical protein
LAKEGHGLQKTTLGIGAFPIKNSFQRVDPNAVPQENAHALVTFGRHRVGAPRIAGLQPLLVQGWFQRPWGGV